MARTRKTKAAAPKKTTRVSRDTFWQSAQKDIKTNQSAISIVLGILILVVLGFSIFNFIRGNSNGNLIPAQQTQNQQATNTTPSSTPQPTDVAKASLPGQYTVKSGDTLFTIAQQYYDNGYQYTELAKANNIADVNNISVGQTLQVPNLQIAQAQPQKTSPPQVSPNPSASPQMTTQQNTQLVQGGTGGSADQTEWGEKITGTSYTVQSGDWLSKIAGRAYGDIYQYQKLAAANHIPNPDVIEPGTVIQIPR
jgi:nucleoid-associated protein YgaU